MSLENVIGVLAELSLALGQGLGRLEYFSTTYKRYHGVVSRIFDYLARPLMVLITPKSIASAIKLPCISCHGKGTRIRSAGTFGCSLRNEPNR